MNRINGQFFWFNTLSRAIPCLLPNIPSRCVRIIHCCIHSTWATTKNYEFSLQIILATFFSFPLVNAGVTRFRIRFHFSFCTTLITFRNIVFCKFSFSFDTNAFNNYFYLFFLNPTNRFWKCEKSLMKIRRNISKSFVVKFLRSNVYELGRMNYFENY